MKFEIETPRGIIAKLLSAGCPWINRTEWDSGGMNEYGGEWGEEFIVQYGDDIFELSITEVIEDDPNWAQAECYHYTSYKLNGSNINEPEALKYIMSIKSQFDRVSKIDKIVE
jgi:hypothetical protein